jgi:hypothetical protein
MWAKRQTLPWSLHGDLVPQEAAIRVRAFLRRHPKKVLFSVNLGVFLLLLLIAELGVRMFAPTWLQFRMNAARFAGDRPPEVGTDANWKVERKDGRFLRFVPGSSFDVLHPEYVTPAQFDEFGGRKVVPQRTSTELLPWLGDSFAFGLGVESSEAFVSLLQGSVPQRLLNLGVPGSALDSHRFIVENRHVELGRPRLYVFVVYLGNDFADVLNSRRNDNPQPQSPSRQVGALQAVSLSVNSFVNRSVLSRSFLIQYVKRPLLQLLNKRSPDSLLIEPIFLLMDRRLQPYRAEAEAAMDSEMAALASDARRLGFRCLFIAIPDRHQVSGRRLRERARFYGIDLSELETNSPNALLRGLIEKHGFELLDPTEEMSRRPDVDGLYYVSDDHLTAAGHRAVAQILSARFAAKVRDLRE